MLTVIATGAPREELVDYGPDADEMLAALTAFLAPYRDGSAAAHTPGRKLPRFAR